MLSRSMKSSICYSTNSQFYSYNTLKDLRIVFLFWRYHRYTVLRGRMDIPPLHTLSVRGSNPDPQAAQSHRFSLLFSLLPGNSTNIVPNFTTTDVQSKVVKAVNSTTFCVMLLYNFNATCFGLSTISRLHGKNKIPNKSYFVTDTKQLFMLVCIVQMETLHFS
jgi:hypothetical protein